jgi:hypothetical protein
LTQHKFPDRLANLPPLEVRLSVTMDNAKSVAHMPTAEAAKEENKNIEPHFKVDPAASPMPEIRQPERLEPRARLNRNGGRDHLGIL